MSEGPLYQRLPCRGQSYHDFAVGLTHAICNRCEKVVTISQVRTGDQPWDWPNRIGGGWPDGYQVRFDSTVTNW